MIKEPELKNKKKVISKLRPFCRKYLKIEERFKDKITELEKKMSKKIGLGIALEFFYVDNEYVGIGVLEIKDRNKFPLLHESEFN